MSLLLGDMLQTNRHARPTAQALSEHSAFSGENRVKTVNLGSSKADQLVVTGGFVVILPSNRKIRSVFNHDFVLNTLIMSIGSGSLGWWTLIG